MLSKKKIWNVPDRIFSHLLQDCGVAVDREDNFLYVYFSGDLYEYPLPEVEDLDEAGRTLVTKAYDQHRDAICGLPWLIAMVENRLIDDDVVLLFALGLTQTIEQSSPVTVIAVEMSRQEFESLVQTLGVDQAAAALGLPEEFVWQVYDSLNDGRSEE